MDFTKLPLEKLLYFVAGVIPGFVVLLIFQAAHPYAFGWFVNLAFLGYKTKISLILLVAFVAGNTLTASLSSTVYAASTRCGLASDDACTVSAKAR
jgi:hypothetical protein